MKKLISALALITLILIVEGCTRIVTVPAPVPVLRPPQPQSQSSQFSGLNETGYQNLYTLYCMAYAQGSKGASCSAMQTRIYEGLSASSNSDMRTIAFTMSNFCEAACESGQKGEPLMDYNTFKSGLQRLMGNPTHD